MISESRAGNAIRRAGAVVPGGQVIPMGQSGGAVGVYERSTYGGGDVFGPGVGYYGTACYDCGAFYQSTESAATGRFDRGTHFDRGITYA